MIISITEPVCKSNKNIENWFIYIVECCDQSLYTGITNNLEKRLSTHNSGKGAKYTRGRGPIVLKYFEKVSNKNAALKREIEIKKLTRKQKILLFQKNKI